MKLGAAHGHPRFGASARPAHSCHRSIASPDTVTLPGGVRRCALYGWDVPALGRFESAAADGSKSARATGDEKHMRHTTLLGWTLMFTVASLGFAGAQAGVPRPSPPAPDLSRSVTMTGCLRSWDGSPAGIGRGDATGPGAQFVLTNVEETAPATPRTPVGTSGSGSAAPATTAAVAHDTYVVQA